MTTFWVLARSQVLCESDFEFVDHIAARVAQDQPITIVDAGANIGLASILLAQVCGHRCQILAIEASPATSRLAVMNTRQLRGKVQVIQAALVSNIQASSHSHVAMVGKPHHESSWRLKSVAGSSDANVVHFSVATTTLTQLQVRHFAQMACFHRELCE